MERLDWILSQENKFLTGHKAGRSDLSYKTLSKEAKTLLVEEVTLLKKVQSNKEQAKIDYRFSLVEKYLTEGHAGHYWVVIAKRRSALGKRSDRDDDKEGGGVMKMGPSSYKRPHKD